MKTYTECYPKDDVGRKHLMKCPRCHKKFGRMRAGAEFAGEAICANCYFVWKPNGLPFYSYIP